MSGRVVFVTGASSGFGAAVARRFVARGDHIVAAARRRERLETLADEPGADEVILSGGSGRGLSCRLLASAGEGEEGCKLLAGRTRLRTPRTGARVEQSHVRTG